MVKISTKSFHAKEEIEKVCIFTFPYRFQIPSVKTVVAAVTMIEDEIDDIVRKHGTLLRKGLNLSHVPTVNEVLKRSLPSPSQTSGEVRNENFVNLKKMLIFSCLKYKNIFSFSFLSQFNPFSEKSSLWDLTW